MPTGCCRSWETLGCRRRSATERPRQALRFTWDATTDQMVSVYDEVLAHPRLNLGVHRPLRHPSPSVRICHSSSHGHYQRIRTLTCGNVELTTSRPARTVRLAPSSRSTDRGDRTRFRSRRKAETEPGEPTKAARPDAELRGADEGRKAGTEPSGPGRRRKDEAGSGPRRNALGGPQGSPAAAGAPQGEPLGSRRSERLRASRTRRARRSAPRRRGGCLEHLSPRG